MGQIHSNTRSIGFLVYPDFQILDLTGPLSVFQIANEQLGSQAYELHTVSQFGGLVASTAPLAVATAPAENFAFDTLVVAGGEGACEISRLPTHIALLQTLAAHTRRMTSVCTGAFLLASAGLLVGRRAATHWRYAPLLQREHPTVRVEPEPIFVKDGPVWTSAGVTAGMDLALALVEEDLGTLVSRAVARELVMYHRRPGGQTQFSAMLELEPASDRIRRALTYAREHLAEPLSVAELAKVVHLSERQFGRAFRAETGETPARAIERLRVEAARVRLENGAEPIEVLAASIGFVDPERMRRAFLRVFGHPPQALRRMAQARKASVDGPPILTSFSTV
jgi:transcriptional regulator GlxA family with amidase domain